MKKLTSVRIINPKHKIVLLATTLIYFLNLINGQAFNPDHYFDFMKSTMINGKEYYLDQVTQDDRLAFGSLRKEITLI